MIYAVLSRVNRCYSLSHYRPILVESIKIKKVADLPVLATSRFGTLVMLSSQVNCPVPHRSTR